MKILVIAPTPFFADRGTHIRILEESLALEKLGHDVTIATYHIGKNIDGEVATKIDVRRIRRLLFWYKKLEAGPDWQKIILDLMLVRKAFNLARTQKPDIIHGHLHEGVLIGWIVQKALFWRKMKLVADFHGSLTKEMESHSYLKGGLLNTFFRFIEKTIDNLGDRAITSSWENTDEIKTLRNDAHVETVLDGVNVSYYRSLEDKAVLRKELELPEDKKIITYAGALIFNKGIDYLLSAIPIVLKKRTDAFFVIAGFPAEGVQKFVDKHGIAEHVRLISPLNYFDMPKLLKASDVGVDPKDSSTRQASGKILQYMAAGLPVVCFDRKNNHEYLDETGFYCHNDSVDAFASKIIESIENDQQRLEKGKSATIRAEAFSWDESGKKIDAIYKAV